MRIRTAELDAGLAQASEWSVHNALDEGGLVKVLDEWSPTLPGLSVHYPGHRHLTAAMHAILDVERRSLTYSGAPFGADAGDRG